MAFPHKTAAFPHLAAVVPLPARDQRPRAAARRADARDRTTTPPTGRDRHEGGRLMDDPQRRRSGGRAARQALRLAAHAEHVPFLTRKLAPFEVLGEEGLSLIEHNADTILEEVGVEFRGDPEALRLLRDAGADVDGVRVRFPRGMCRRIVQATAPRQFTQYARNPERNVEIGGMHTVFAPNYGSPFVRDLDSGRRYGTIEDFRNLVKLTYVSPLPPPLGRDGLRAGRRAGQQAPPRHGLFAHPLQRQAVHGLGHRAGAGARHGRDGPPDVRRRLPRGPHGHHSA